MNMQDNELDDLFCSKLSQMEVEPDARVWKGIDARVNPPVRKSGLPLMRIAASIVVVLTAGIWLVNQYKQPKIVGANSNRVAKHNNPAIITEAPSPQTATIAVDGPAMPKSQNRNSGHEVNRMLVAAHTASHKKVTSSRQITTLLAPQDVSTTHTADATMTMAQNRNIDKPVLPDITLAAGPVINNTPVLKTNMAPATLVTAHATENKAKKHGIHTLGDLINVVVAKVDKREDKLIEFTDVDDDEATVTGINLGFIKIKQDR